MQLTTHILKDFNPQQLKDQFKNGMERQYVALMMDVVGRGLVTASYTDEVVRHEIRGFPVGYVVSMNVFPRGPQFAAQVQSDHGLKLVNDYSQKPDLTITFKHMHHAFLVLSFQESTARAFANDRMIADGEVSAAIRLVRCLNRMESLILPKIIAQLAVKSYPKDLKLIAKLHGATKIYSRVAQSYLQRSK